MDAFYGHLLLPLGLRFGGQQLPMRYQGLVKNRLRKSHLARRLFPFPLRGVDFDTSTTTACS